MLLDLLGRLGDVFVEPFSVPTLHPLDLKCTPFERRWLAGIGHRVALVQRCSSLLLCLISMHDLRQRLKRLGRLPHRADQRGKLVALVPVFVVIESRLHPTVSPFEPVLKVLTDHVVALAAYSGVFMGLGRVLLVPLALL